jgi:hypothetical protein
MKTTQRIMRGVFGSAVGVLVCTGGMRLVMAQDAGSTAVPRLLTEGRAAGSQETRQVAPAKALGPGGGSEFARENSGRNPTKSQLSKLGEPGKGRLEWMLLSKGQPSERLESSYKSNEHDTLGTALTREQPVYSLPVIGKPNGWQVKTEVTTHDAQTGSAWLGIKLIIPFGRGG